MKELTVSFELPFPDALVAQIGKTQIIRSSYLSSSEKLKKVIEYSDSPRITFVQYNPEENDWIKIVHEHRRLSKIQLPHVHLSLPTLAPLYPKPTREETYREREIGDTLPKLLNMEGWALYSSWLHEKFEQALAKFKFDAIDEYTLEAYIEDFRHEVYSDILTKDLIDIHNLDLPEVKTTIEEEKELIRLRQELRRMIEAQHAILEDIVSCIQSIEKVHPELTQIKNLSILLKNVLKNQLLPFDSVKLTWGLQEMCLQLLDDDLGVLPVLNCSQDHGRTYFAMALRIAILQLKGSYSVRELIDMIDHWDSDTPLVKQCKSLILENIIKINEIKPHSKQPLQHDLAPHLEYLNYLPHDNHLMVYDTSGRPTGLTDAGQKLFTFN